MVRIKTVTSVPLFTIAAEIDAYRLCCSFMLLWLSAILMEHSQLRSYVAMYNF